jgi:hypothetical protein
MQTQHDGRTYTLTNQAAGDHLGADLAANGFDPVIYHGVAAPIGRQRKTFRAMFYRAVSTGKFVPVF